MWPLMRLQAGTLSIEAQQNRHSEMNEHRHFAANATRDGVSSTSTASDNPDSETMR